MVIGGDGGKAEMRDARVVLGVGHYYTIIRSTQKDLAATEGDIGSGGLTRC